jgi:hypothetical protein
VPQQGLAQRQLKHAHRVPVSQAHTGVQGQSVTKLYRTVWVQAAAACTQKKYSRNHKPFGMFRDGNCNNARAHHTDCRLPCSRPHRCSSGPLLKE